jgi:hypothetical protein
MSPFSLVRTLLASAALAAATATSAFGQADGPTPVGVVRGTVYDSTAQAPLADAAVFLWNTPYRAVTDEDGAFLITDVPPGDYTLLFFHTRLGEMGISPGPRQVRIVGRDTVDVALGTPSMFTMMVTPCLLEEPGPRTGAIAGWVGDGESGMGLPRAQVVLSWTPEGATQPTRLSVDTDAGGWYHTCRAPSDMPIVATATFLDRQGLRREVTVSEGGAVEVGFLLWELDPANVSGRILDATSGVGVSDAEVWLRGTAFRAVTGSHGEFRFGKVPPGTYMMFARHLQYGTRQDTLIVASGRTMKVDMHVDARAIAIAPITVTVESVPTTRRAMGGLTITREDIDKVRGRVRDAADILQAQHVPGVIVRRRADSSLCVGYSSGQVRMYHNESGGCVPMTIFINDVRATNTDLALQMPPESIDRIVVFKPWEAGNLFGAGSGNGVLVIYTHNR